MSDAKHRKVLQKRIFRSSRARSVTVYLSCLFVITILLLILAYFMQERSSQVMAVASECFT